VKGTIYKKKEDNMLHKNQFVRFITLGIIILSLTLVSCAIKKPMWGDPQTGLILKYNIAQDQALNYKSISDANQTMEMMGQSMKTSTKINMDYSIKGTGTDNQNNLLTQVNINNLNINITGMQGERALDTSSFKGKSFGVAFSPKGKETEFTGIDDLPKIDFGEMSGGEQSVKNYFLNLLPDLSDDPIKVGGTWTDQIEDKIQRGPLELTIKGESTNVLEGLETIKGMECVRIKTQAESAVQGSGNMMGNDIKIKGDIKSTSIWYFAYKKGLFVKASGDEESDIKIEVGAMGEMPQVSKSKTEIDLVL
jgi:hypothetical protein